jgi:uncharacterized coiled-coil protein SlyX
MTVNLSDLNRSVSELQRSTGRIEGKLDTFIEQMKASDERGIKLSERVDKVENRQHWYSGVSAAFGMLLGFGTEHTFK